MDATALDFSLLYNIIFLICIEFLFPCDWDRVAVECNNVAGFCEFIMLGGKLVNGFNMSWLKGERFVQSNKVRHVILWKKFQPTLKLYDSVFTPLQMPENMPSDLTRKSNKINQSNLPRAALSLLPCIPNHLSIKSSNFILCTITMAMWWYMLQ